MRRVNVSQLRPGMKLATAVKDDGGRLLLHPGLELDEPTIDRLARRGVLRVYIDDPRFQGLEFPEPVPDHSLRAARELFAAWEDALAGGEPRPCVAQDPVRQVVAGLEAHLAGHLLQPLVLLPVGRSHYWADQALNAARLTLAIATRLSLYRYAVDIASGAFVRDVGLLTLPPELRFQVSPLETVVPEAIREHPSTGLACLESPDLWAPLAKLAIGQHHERLDGSGFPAGLAGDRIHLAAAMVAVIDAYVNLLGGDGTGTCCTPEQALEYVLSAAGSGFDVQAVRALCHSVGLYAPGTLVRLSTGEEAVVIEPGRGTYQRPKVRMVSDGRAIDLQQPACLSVQVAAVVEP